MSLVVHLYELPTCFGYRVWGPPLFSVSHTLMSTSTERVQSPSLLPSPMGPAAVWDKYGQSRNLGLFKDFEAGNHDGAYEGRLHSRTLFIGCKVFIKHENEYNNVHGYYCVRGEHPICPFMALEGDSGHLDGFSS